MAATYPNVRARADLDANRKALLRAFGSRVCLLHLLVHRDRRARLLAAEKTVGRLDQTVDALVVPGVDHWGAHCREQSLESAPGCHRSASEAARVRRAAETELWLRQPVALKQVACPAVAGELWEALPAEDARQSAVLGSAQGAEVAPELVLQPGWAQPVREPQAVQVLRLLGHAVQGPPVLQRVLARPEARWVPLVSRAQAQHLSRAVPLPVHELPQAHGVLLVSLQRELVRRPTELPVASAQAWPVPSLPLPRLLLLPQRHATAAGPSRRLQRGWSSSESFSRLRQSPAKDQLSPLP